MTTPKLVSLPVHPANVKKAPKHTNQAEYESFLILNIIILTHSTITYVQLSKNANHKVQLCHNHKINVIKINKNNPNQSK